MAILALFGCHGRGASVTFRQHGLGFEWIGGCDTLFGEELLGFIILFSFFIFLLVAFLIF